MTVEIRYVEESSLEPERHSLQARIQPAIFNVKKKMTIFSVE